jgi:hypothetical protein
MFGGVFCIGFGLAMVALVIFGALPRPQWSKA